MLLALALILLTVRPTFSIPTTVPTIAVSPDTPVPNPSHLSHRVIFDIAFALVLFLVIIGSFTWLASRMTTSRFVELVDRMYGNFRTLIQGLSSFRLATFIEMAATAILNPYDASATQTRRGDHVSSQISTASSQVRMQVQRAGVDVAVDTLSSTSSWNDHNHPMNSTSLA
ncbi:hypothetical protein B0F90DRAFT_1669157 [Multifurca ochricompacta]|uniref:Uncharacterized protein n=1 Tax=Multifurca ochricompacta TaxID=376703 RepID=A0AAD4M160_9AGAM|nr:hypothetical protein B0F90DRAFT_1669157 [Multifurca ochricompacta]